MTRLLLVLGLLSLAAFVYLWYPGGFLLAGLAFLWLAAVRTDNKKRGARP